MVESTGTISSNSTDATQGSQDIEAVAQDLWRDDIVNIDEKSTIDVNELIKNAYTLEQNVTDLVIEDITKECENINTIANSFESVDTMLANLVGSL